MCAHRNYPELDYPSYTSTRHFHNSFFGLDKNKSLFSKQQTFETFFSEILVPDFRKPGTNLTLIYVLQKIYFAISLRRMKQSIRYAPTINIFSMKSGSSTMDTCSHTVSSLSVSSFSLSVSTALLSSMPTFVFCS